MQAITFGPLLLPVTPLLALGAWLLAVLIAARLRRAGAADAEPALFALLLLGLLAARAGFVLEHWAVFRAAPWTVLDLRDRGVLLTAGVAIVIPAALLLLWRRPLLRRPLLSSAGAGLLAFVLASGFAVALTPQRLPLPELDLQTLSGSEQALAITHDRPLVLNLWATWCPPCRRELPLLIAAAQRRHSVRFLLVDQQEDAATVRDYLARAGLDARAVRLDPQGALAHYYRVPGYPTTLFIGADGRLRDAHVGELSAATLGDRLRALSAPAR